MIRIFEKANYEKIDLEKEYQYLNDKIFNGQLPEDIEFEWKPLKNVAGRVEHISVSETDLRPSITTVESLILSTFFDMTKESLINVLIHEMVHVYIVEILNRPECGHCILFKTKVREINKRFPEYDVKQKEDKGLYKVEPSIVKKGKTYYFIIFNYSDGINVIAVFRNLIFADNIEEEINKFLNKYRVTKKVESVEFGRSNELELKSFKISKDLLTAVRYKKFYNLEDFIYDKLKNDIEGDMFI